MAATSRSVGRLTYAASVGDSQLTFDSVDAADTVDAAHAADTALAVAAAEPVVEVRRSARRRRTVSAYRDGDRTVVLVPARLSRAEEQRLVAEMVAMLAAKQARLRPSDAELLERAQALAERYLHGRAQPRSVAWVGNQERRWGSCTVDDATIRLSDRLKGMPTWVVDYVLLHELAHLIEPGHGPAFWRLLEAYPQLERARGFLEGVSAVYDEGVGRTTDTA